jgi:hypothetical protein
MQNAMILAPVGVAKSSRAVTVSGKVWVRRKEIISLCNNLLILRGVAITLIAILYVVRF